MTCKICLITGANSGIGKQAAIQLAQNGFKVFVGVRSLARGEAALKEIKPLSNPGAVELINIDLSAKKSIQDAANLLRKQISHLDVLIHNAADFDISRKQAEISDDGVETIWATNHIGPVLLTNSVMDLIKNSVQGRIITIASQGLVMHPNLTVDLNDPEFKKKKFAVPNAYYQSKLAQIMYTYWLAEQFKDSCITANCIRVTNVKVDTSRYPNISRFMKFLYSIKSRFSISPEEMAETYTFLASSTDLAKTTGKYFNEKNSVVSSSPYSMNKENIDAVMKLTLKYLN